MTTQQDRVEQNTPDSLNDENELQFFAYGLKSVH